MSFCSCDQTFAHMRERTERAATWFRCAKVATQSSATMTL